MVKLCLEPYDYHLPIVDFNGKSLLVTSSSMEFGVKLSRKIKKGQWFWNHKICSYSDAIGKMPRSYFTGEMMDGMLCLHWHPGIETDPIPRTLIVNPFTGFMAEPDTLKYVEKFNGRQDILSTLWNLHCGFISLNTVRNMATQQLVPKFVVEGSKVTAMVPTRDYTYVIMSLSKFMLRYGEFAEYFCSRMDPYIVEKEDVVNG